MDAQTIKAAVRERYAGVVTQNQGCCGGGDSLRASAPNRAAAFSCGCGPATPDETSLSLGYASQDLASVPEGANLGLGCGNPVAMASLKPGETVLDLGSGAGFDAFLAAARVGPEGRVIGVDMTPEMVERATTLAAAHGYANVEFRLGDIEALPVDDASVDAIISNCVVNLTTDKAKAFREAFRVLKPGGRLMVSDIVLDQPLPEAIREDMDAYGACVAGALLKPEYLAAIDAAGFSGVTIVNERSFPLGEMSPELLEAARQRHPELSPQDLDRAANSVLSIQVEATKAGRPCGCAPTCCGG